MERYNGWANYPTWAVGLWIGNDEDSDEYASDLAMEAEDVYDLAQKIKEWITENAPEGADMYDDLMGWALEMVNWREVADHYWDTLRAEKVEEEEEEDEDEE